MRKENLLSGTIWAYPRIGFWLVHTLGVVLVGYLGYFIIRTF